MPSLWRGLLFEYLHLNWELSWPWLTLGNVFAYYPALVQWYEYTGVAGGTLWVLLLNILICEQALHFTQKPPLIRNFPDAIKAYIQLVWKPALLFLLPVLVSLAIYYSYSEQGKAIEVAVLQPNIDPYNEKFEPQLAQQQLERFIQLSDSICTEHITYMVWLKPLFRTPFGGATFFRSCNRGALLNGCNNAHNCN
ncbi:MAG: hypothetical protein IPL35_05810 [Sphingobacteriales bacterium]|nr:hypothetical protein [Sphingobacteriales bacterium]